MAGRDALLLLNLGLHIFNGVRWLDLEGDSLVVSERLEEDLHATEETDHQYKIELILDVVVGEGTTILELLSSEDQALLAWSITLLLLNLGLHFFNSVGWIDVKFESLACKRFYENLHVDFDLACFTLIFFFFNYNTSVHNCLNSLMDHSFHKI